MWHTLDRVVKTFSDLTLGTMIVLAHAAIAHRRSRPDRALYVTTADGTRMWRSQVSP
jgi:hypothetical protein